MTNILATEPISCSATTVTPCEILSVAVSFEKAVSTVPGTCRLGCMYIFYGILLTYSFQYESVCKGKETKEACVIALRLYKSIYGRACFEGSVKPGGGDTLSKSVIHDVKNEYKGGNY